MRLSQIIFKEMLQFWISHFRKHYYSSKTNAMVHLSSPTGLRIEDRDGEKQAYTLCVDLHFFEFIPVDSEDEQPPTLLAHQVLSFILNIFIGRKKSNTH